MNTSKILQRVILFLVSGHNISSLIIQTKDVTVLHEKNDILLNCTYQKDSKVEISNRDIRWQKRIGGKFVDIAMFSPPSGQEPFIIKEMQHIYSNRTELIAPNTSLSAVMIIKDPACNDEGTYQCKILYYSDNSEKIQTSRSLVEFHAKAEEPEEFLVFPNELEENHSISLICSAYVGSPRGNIQIWRESHNSDKSKLISQSNSINNNTNNCTEFINMTTTYTVTREDNGAVFRCSSQNNLTQRPGPSKYSQKISVIYGPDETKMTLTPNKSMYTVGDRLTIQCITDSNPLPAFKWYFRPNGLSKEKTFEITQDKLVFDSLQVTDSGTYICTVVNEARSNSPSATTHVSVRKYHGCSQCRYIEICQQNYDEIVCIPNNWVPTAVVFMILSVAFAVSSHVLFKTRKKSQEIVTLNHMNNTRSHPYDTPEDDGGGYWSPTDLNRTQEAVCPSSEDIGDAHSQSRDLIKMQERSMLLTNRNEPDGYTTTEDVVQYAAVQKKSTKDQVSDENVYDSAWNSDVLFQLRQEAQGPHRSPEQQ